MKAFDLSPRKQVVARKAQTLVEFAILLPFLVLIIAVIVDFGFLFYDHVATQAACREGARAMVQANDGGAPIYDFTQLKKIVKSAHGPLAPLLDAEILITEDPSSTKYPPGTKRVRVIEIAHVHTWIMPIMIPFGQTIFIRSRVEGFCVPGLQGI